MTASTAKAEVFWLAFKSLKREEQYAFLQRLLQDKELSEDLEDILIAYSRRSEPARPLQDVLDELK